MGLDDTPEHLGAKRKKHGSHASKAAPGTKGDRMNIAILLFLYTLQGVPLGLSAAIPITMQKKHITYKEQVERLCGMNDSKHGFNLNSCF